MHFSMKLYFQMITDFSACFYCFIVVFLSTCEYTKNTANLTNREEPLMMYRFYDSNCIQLFWPRNDGCSSIFRPINDKDLKHVRAAIAAKNILRGLSPRANYTDRRTAACWRSLLQIEVCHEVSVMDPYGRILRILDRSHYFVF
jgi:hypothetical protein